MQNQCLSLLNMQICDVLPVLVIDKARYGRLIKGQQETLLSTNSYTLLHLSTTPEFLQSRIYKNQNKRKKTTTTTTAYLASTDYKASFFSFPGEPGEYMGSGGRDSNKTKPAQKKKNQNKTKTIDINLSSNNYEVFFFSFSGEPRECMGPDGRVLWAPKLEYKEI